LSPSGIERKTIASGEDFCLTAHPRKAQSDKGRRHKLKDNNLLLCASSYRFYPIGVDLRFDIRDLFIFYMP
jgi:hypothetical protein